MVHTLYFVSKVPRPGSGSYFDEFWTNYKRKVILMSTISFKYVTNANGNEMFCEMQNDNKTRDVNSLFLTHFCYILVILTTKKMPYLLPLPLWSPKWLPIFIRPPQIRMSFNFSHLLSYSPVIYHFSLLWSEGHKKHVKWNISSNILRNLEFKRPNESLRCSE